MAHEYINLINFLIISTILVTILLILNKIVTLNIKQKFNNQQKLSSYECGFDPLEETKLQFNIKYYLIAILYLIFDIELIYIFPLISTLFSITTLGFLIFCIFILFLIIAFIIEIKIGILKF